MLGCPGGTVQFDYAAVHGVVALNHRDATCTTANSDFDQAARHLYLQWRATNGFSIPKRNQYQYRLFGGTISGSISKAKIDKLWRWTYRRPLKLISEAIGRLPATGNPGSPCFVVVSAPGFSQSLQHPLLRECIEGYCRDAKLPDPAFISSSADVSTTRDGNRTRQGTMIAEGAAYAAAIGSGTKTLGTEIPMWKSSGQVFWESRNKLRQEAIQNQTIRRSARLQPDPKESSHDLQSRKRKEPSSDPKSDEARTSCTTAVVAPTTSIFGNGMRESKRQKTGP